MIKRFFIAFLGLFLIFCASCRKVIDLKVNNTDPKLVIEAKYDAVNEKVSVNISKTISVFSVDTFPIITNAQVEIIDATGYVTPLINVGGGSYVVENYLPFYNSKYKVNVIIDGTVYSSTDSLVNVVPIDTLTQDKLPENPLVEDGFAVYVNFQDPQTPNFYRIRIKENNEWQTDLTDQYIFDDTYTTGSYTQLPLLPNMYNVGDSVTIRLISYSKKAYDYFYALLSVAGSSTSSPAPANPPQDWTNKALGSFIAYGYDQKQITIQP